MPIVEARYWECGVCGYRWPYTPNIVPDQCRNKECRSRRWNRGDVAGTSGVASVNSDRTKESVPRHERQGNKQTDLAGVGRVSDSTGPSGREPSSSGGQDHRQGSNDAGFDNGVTSGIVHDPDICQEYNCRLCRKLREQ